MKKEKKREEKLKGGRRQNNQLKEKKKKEKERPEKSYLILRGSLNKFPYFFRMGTFIDCTHMKLFSPSK